MTQSNNPSQRAQIIAKVLSLQGRLTEIDAAIGYLQSRRETIADAPAAMEKQLQTTDARPAEPAGE